MIIALVIRRMPYTIRSATATLMHIPISAEEAARSLGASKLKTFFRVTTPMMATGITSGAILSFVSIVTEMSSAIILYNNKTITLTMSAYVAISRGNYGLACAFSAILTVLTAVILIVYLQVHPRGGHQDVTSCTDIGDPCSDRHPPNPWRNNEVQETGPHRHRAAHDRRPGVLQRRGRRRREHGSGPVLLHDRERPSAS